MDVMPQLLRLSQDQLGIFSLRQARELHISENAITHAVAKGWLRRVRTGILAIAGATDSWEQHVLAAVLAGNENCFASHATAAKVCSLTTAHPDIIEVTALIDRQLRIPGVRAHRCGTLHEHDITEVRGIPVTSPARTIVDLSSRSSVDELAKLIDAGLRQRVLTLAALHACLVRLGIAPGRSPKKLQAVLAARTPGYEPGESTLETAVFDAIVRGGLPAPVRQFPVKLGRTPYRLDLAYPEQRIAIEVDGFDFHRTRSDFDRDRTRQNALVLARWTVLRFTSQSTAAEIVESVRGALFGQSHGS